LFAVVKFEVATRVNVGDHFVARFVTNDGLNFDWSEEPVLKRDKEIIEIKGWDNTLRSELTCSERANCQKEK
jgi:hypothetical protein